MPQIVLKQAAFYPAGVIHPSGTVLDVTDDEAADFRARGLVAESGETETQAVESEEPTEVAEVASEDEEPVAGDYPPLPKKTAPVAEWKEYARRNAISLTGVTKRNEIIGYLTKVVNS